ncbi:hypothetical protein EDD11_002399 [Mortierella claussenii]|nr:hypothetical protein EDD11_002399 [Mortierella claussenii]
MAPRSLTSMVMLAIATAFTLLAVLSSSEQLFADAQTGTTNPECAPLHVLYKAWVDPCIANGVPATDADPAWKPCICKNGFYPLASASENCALDGTVKKPQITPVSLNALCIGQPNYVDASKQKALPDLAPALASATSISMSPPTPTAGAGGSGSGSGDNTGGIRPNSAVSDRVGSGMMMMLASVAAVVLVTATGL